VQTLFHPMMIFLLANLEDIVRKLHLFYQLTACAPLFHPKHFLKLRIIGWSWQLLLLPVLNILFILVGLLFAL